MLFQCPRRLAIKSVHNCCRSESHTFSRHWLLWLFDLSVRHSKRRISTLLGTYNWFPLCTSTYIAKCWTHFCIVSTCKLNVSFRSCDRVFVNQLQTWYDMKLFSIICAFFFKFNRRIGSTHQIGTCRLLEVNHYTFVTTLSWLTRCHTYFAPTNVTWYRKDSSYTNTMRTIKQNDLCSSTGLADHDIFTDL